MAFNNDQNDFPLPMPGDENRQTANLLPKYFRTVANKKFLNSTLDQMIQPGVAEKISAYYGRKTAKSYRAGDVYVSDVSDQRQNRQLEPAAVVKDNLNNVEFYKDYADLINQIKAFGGNVNDQSLLNSQEFYAWNPNIEWDKLVNFREYYWLPNGPRTVSVFGQSKSVTSTYTVSLQDNQDNVAYLFSPDGKTGNPSLKLYRGQTYRFEIDTPGHPIAFAVNRSFTPGEAVVTATTEGIFASGAYDATLYDLEAYDLGDYLIIPPTVDIGFTEGENISNLYNDGIEKTDERGRELAVVFVEKGIIEFTVPLNAPDKLFYISNNDVNVSGLVKIYDIEENSFINVEQEILGKKTYTSANGVEFSNGMKVRFGGDVSPEVYASDEFYVEGVGDKIVLIKESDLIIPSAYAADKPIPFDTDPFDRFPFGTANGFPEIKDYITINRASRDRNAWSRYNRWFHKDVIQKSAEYNGVIGAASDLDQEARAKRPIIEFEAGLKLYNFGTEAKDDIDLIDTFTKDAFSTIEGQLGYNVDGVQLAEDMRIIFVADTDRIVKSKTYRVKFINFNNRRQISLIEEPDVEPMLNQTVLVKDGNTQRGKMYFFDGTVWAPCQEKVGVNQAPLFDLYNEAGNSYSDELIYPNSTFAGNKIFSYRTNTQEAVDAELGFPLSYRSIENVGDIVFDFNLLNETCTYQINNDLFTLFSDVAFLRKYEGRETFVNQNGWARINELSSQYVIRQFEVIDPESNSVAVDVYDRSGDLNDLLVNVYLNNAHQIENQDFDILRVNGIAYVRFLKLLAVNDVIVLRTRSSALKNQNGFYEIAYNLERNPLNNNLGSFTLGEVNDHVDTMIEEIPNFQGIYPGPSNLRDLGNLDVYGRRFLQHSGPLNLSLFHITDKDANIVKAIKYNRAEYAKFKRVFLQTAENLGYDGPVKQHVDLILQSINKDKTEKMPFYFSDMAPYNAPKRLEYKVLAAETDFYALTKQFDLNELTPHAVTVYKNGIQLVFAKDYEFTEEGFVRITADKQIDDIIEIYEYESTDGSFIPPTPTKLGLYPKFEPQIYVDSTYQILRDTDGNVIDGTGPRKVIQGHDGSIIVAFNDYRDDLVLELEKRIYNNIKQKYRTDIIDIHDFVGGEYRSTRFTKSAIDRSMTSDFIEWNTIAGDPEYTRNNFNDPNNSFTFNYARMSSPRGNPLPGFWRAVYQQAYDTDRPHTHPWEMLGFTVKPTWWNITYGPAPYTNGNLILWGDLEEGIVREPNKPVRRLSKYARPGLTRHIPVNDSGELISPLDSGYAKEYVSKLTSLPFSFGDQPPVESAWRRSSEYPYSLITAWILNQPNKIIGLGFDNSRIKRNSVGQLVYTETNKAIRLEDIVFPNTAVTDQRVNTAGLVNFIYNYMTSDVVSSYESYQSKLKRITNQLSIKVGGFTDKDKFKLILDSRTPFNQGNVFVPPENYQIFLNTSSPIDVITYSGVIIEKTADGFVIKGYDRVNPTFTCYEPILSQNDPVINVGGISEAFIDWSERKQYVKGQNVRYNNDFYRVVTSHISTATFDVTNFVKMPFLPQVGGRDAVFRKNYSKRELALAYGTSLPTIQSVVDFLLGYEAWLIDQGFDFEYFNNELETVDNFRLSAREFMFWTTQNWAAGSVITLSPAANKIKFSRNFAVVDDIFDNFYDYSLLKADGRKLQTEFTSIDRSNQNEFGLKPVATDDGIFQIKLPLVQKEHVVLLDNETVFRDIIYDPEPGYRQERIKVVGYRSDNWTGGLNVPGFIYDSATITDWQSWKDYAIGSIVKYKEFYYTALVDIRGTENFIANQWSRLAEKPVSQLYPNFDYKINQFADYYDLDSDNFDSEQQRLAQHLIGYQKRQYLQNIINDDVSQYKFYQGFIADKGTKNALSKLFDALSSADKDSLEFYEEWAVRIGMYGATENYDEVDFILDESKFRLSPQPIELVETLDSTSTDLVYRQRPFEVYSKPDNYNHKPFPVKTDSNNFLRSSGYVREADVRFRVLEKTNLLTANVNAINMGDYVWVVGLDNDWDVLQHERSTVRLTAIENFSVAVAQSTTPGAVATFDGIPDFAEGDIIGITNIDTADSFYQVAAIRNNTAELIVPAGFTISAQEGLNVFVTKFRSVRSSNIEQANSIVEEYIFNNQKLWIDNYEGDWKVIEHENVYSPLQRVVNPVEDDGSSVYAYGTSLASSSANTVLAVGSPDEGSGKVRVYTRPSSSNSYRLVQTIDAPYDADNLEQRFGHGLAISPDGRYLMVGSPGASNLRTNYKGEYLTTREYLETDIIFYKGLYWRALTRILPEETTVEFSTHDSYLNLVIFNLNRELNVLLTGNTYLPDVQDTDHLLIRAPLDQYSGSKAGDRIALKWNKYTSANDADNKLEEVQPFDGSINGINASFLSQEHTIVEKIDTVLFVQNYFNLPIQNDIVTTDTAEATVTYVKSSGNDAILYLTNINGYFELSGNLFVNNDSLIGVYENREFTTLSTVGGFWKIATPLYKTPSNDSTNDTFVDRGLGLVYVDLLREGIDFTLNNEIANYNRDKNLYLNILDSVVGRSQDRSLLTNLSHNFFANGSLQPRPSRFWTVRQSPQNIFSVGQEFDFYYNALTGKIEPSNFGFSENYLNTTDHVVFDVWDGYIDFDFTEFVNGEPFEPNPRYEWNGASFVDNGNGDIVSCTVGIFTGLAEVQFYQRLSVDEVRIYVNFDNTNSTGTFRVAQSIVREGVDGAPDRKMGIIRAASLSSNTMGKLIVVDKGSTFEVPNENIDIQQNEYAILGEEYWIFTEDTGVAGIERSANEPSDTNRDWVKVDNIPVVGTIVSNSNDPLTDQGMVSVYEKNPKGEYTFVNSFIDPQQSNSRFGEQIKIVQKDNLYKFLVTSAGDYSNINFGKMTFIKTGTDQNNENYNFTLGVDRDFRGQYDSEYFYTQGQIVVEQNKLYKARTNIASGQPFNTANWELVEQGLDYLGYLPNDLDQPYYQESVFDDTDVLKFVNNFDVNAQGDILAISSNLTNDRAKISIYRLNEDKFILSQTITGPANTGFARSISLSRDGRLLAVGEPYDDSVNINQGRVHVYKQVNGNFEMYQTLNSPLNEESELFGYQVSFDGDQLAVNSRNGNINIPTTFDVFEEKLNTVVIGFDNTGDPIYSAYTNDPESNIRVTETTFDQGFTQFVNKNVDSGSVTVYEKVGDYLLYSEKLIYTEGKYARFGENILVNGSHIYVAMPRLTVDDTYKGAIIDYRKNSNLFGWRTVGEPYDIVDLDKIKSIVLYNKKDNQLLTYLDYVDPLQGKIPGLADQNIYYKTFYDPATYNVGAITELFNELDPWDARQVGRLWWDLSTARFLEPYQGDIIFQTNAWNTIIPGTTIDVYEWVESDLLPEDWDRQSGTEIGIARGITGQTLYSNSLYTQKLTYDSVSQTFGNKFYYWVRNKTSLPAALNRTLSASEVANLIANPAAQGYQYVSLLKDNRFVVHNCRSFINDTDTAISFRYYTQDNRTQNRHIEYQIITEGLETSQPHPDLERKWVDSLVGYDQNSRPVPDPNLSPKQKYGTLFKPRQSWFVNREEALKQVIERVNLVLKQNIIVDDFDLSPLMQQDEPPTAEQRIYDVAVDTVDELAFVGTSRAAPALIDLEIQDGVIVNASIQQTGRGYRVAPTYKIIGSGTGAELRFTINNLGQLNNIEVIQGGSGYGADTAVEVRKLTVLVRSDSTVSNKWSLYEWDNIDNVWNRFETQDFDVTQYWNYADWYAQGYNQFTPVNYLIDFGYELTGLTDSIGDIVKISSIGSGGWLLLRKINNVDTEDYTVNYETIGRQNGTIEFKNTLYDNSISKVGYDSFIYDGKFYDSQPTLELRIILDTIKNNIFVDNLAIEYNQLFLASIRYVLSEQLNVDWVFKTSFIKAKHNLGELEQKITFQNDSLPSYEDYVQEVKPYKTNIREYISAYQRTDNTNSVTTDFDLPPSFDRAAGKIRSKPVRVVNGEFVDLDASFDVYPNKHWLDNAGLQVIEVRIVNPGTGYLSTPVVTLEGGNGQGATARAYVGNGKITKIEVTNFGSGYTSAPRVVIEGSQRDGASTATASVILGNSVVRSSTIKVKFDRINGTPVYTDLKEIETFTGTGSQQNFDLSWPMDMRNTRVKVIVNGIESLRSEFTYDNYPDTRFIQQFEPGQEFKYTDADYVELTQEGTTAAGPGLNLVKTGYSRRFGKIMFTTPPPAGSRIIVEYSKNISMLDAQDRIHNFYNPTAGMIGKSLGQLMNGVDYGGVEVRSFGFDGPLGWDADGWYTDTWDSYVDTREDEIFTFDGSTVIIQTKAPFEQGVEYNLYKNNVRLDDPNYETVNPVTNPNAVMPTIIGDGTTNTVNLASFDITVNIDDIIVIRKSTSDGTFIPNPDSYDTLLQGGDLAYNTARGIAAEEIIVDGDGFVTPTTSKGPEELIPGQVLDTVDIKVYERKSSGQGQILNQNYLTDGIQTQFAFDISPNTTDAVIVKLNGIIIDANLYTIDHTAQQVVFAQAPTANQNINITVIGAGGQQILDISSFIADGSTSEFTSRVPWQDGISWFVTVNGEPITPPSVEIVKLDSSVGFRFFDTPPTEANIDYGIFVGEEVNYSLVTKDTFRGDGSTKTFALAQTPFQRESIAHHLLVMVDKKLLSAGYNQQFVVQTSIREYRLDQWQQPELSVLPVDTRVYINGERLQLDRDYLFDVYTSAVTLFDGIGEPGDTLEIFIEFNGEYTVNGNLVTFDNIPTFDSTIEIYQFSNHDVTGIERQSYTVTARSTLVEGTRQYTDYHNLTNSIINLTQPAAAEQYVWIAVNGDILTPDIDYELDKTRTQIRLYNQITENDSIEVIHFAAPVATNKFAYRQFKDMLNRTVYKRIDNEDIFLTAPLRNYDLRIELTDASSLPEPSKENNRPGVVFIEGERIEYFVKDSNLLRQIRRGTMGTGIKEVYAAGTEVFDQGPGKTVPYKDQTLTQVFTADGTSASYDLDFVPVDSKHGSAKDVIEVFVAGRRLRKTSIQQYQADIALDSPQADITLPEEFTVENGVLTLSETPDSGLRIVVVRKIGKIWTPLGVALKDAQNDIGKFLRAGRSELPE
jgi:hypothetical protein